MDSAICACLHAAVGSFFVCVCMLCYCCSFVQFSGPNENDQMEKRFYIDADIFPNDIHFYFEHSSIDIFFLPFSFGRCFSPLFVSVSCYFYAFEILGSLLAVDFIGINATNESSQVYKLYTIHKDA